MAAFTYPGVYIEEIPSGVHTITGVATSIAAFVGWASMGPTDRAVLVQSWTDFQNQFGGLSSSGGVPNYLGYAVNQFFANGGSQAYIVRLVANAAAIAAGPATTAAGKASVAVPSAGGTSFTATAIDEGGWANNVYGIRIVANPSDATRFSLLVVYTPQGGQESTIESFPNLSLDPSDAQGRGILSVVNDPLTGSQTIAIQSGSVTVANIPTANPLTVPAGNPPYALGATAATQGADGSVLLPGNADFHAVLNANGSVTGVHLLDTVPIFNLLCVPGETDSTTIGYLQKYCHDERAFYIVDCKSNDTFTSLQGGPAGITGDNAINSAF
jgi:hypothetical protein